MQAVIFGMFGISALHRRNASPVHICCASALKAKLAVEEISETVAAKANATLALRIGLLKTVVMIGSHWHRAKRGPVVNGPILLSSEPPGCDGHHAGVTRSFCSA